MEDVMDDMSAADVKLKSIDELRIVTIDSAKCASKPAPSWFIQVGNVIFSLVEKIQQKNINQLEIIQELK